MRRIPRPSLIAGEGKVGLFKSLKNLKGSDLRYAIGYNMSSLRMLGVPLAGLVSLPYDIQQTMNTFKRFSKGATSSLNFQNPAFKRAGVLGFARNVVPRARGAVPKTNVGVIDRYTNLYFGRQTRGAIKMINRGEGKKAALKAFFNPEVVDREIQRQAKRPTNQNVLHNWQLATYMRAVTGAPDPIRNNPFMQAKQFKEANEGKILPRFDARSGILDSKGEHRMMNNERFAQVMGGLEIGAFTNPEASIKTVMDLDMQDYMLSSIEKETAHMRSNLTHNARAAHRDRRKAALQSYYFRSGQEVSDLVGNQYSGTQPTTNMRENRTKYGNLKGYYTDELKDYTNTKVIPSIETALMKDFGMEGLSTQSLKKAMQGAMMVEPDFAVALNNLSVELGFKSALTSSMSPEMAVTRLVDALGNLGITQSVLTSDFTQFSQNIAMVNDQHIRSIIRFTQETQAMGMTGLADAMGELLVSKKALKKMGGTEGGLKALQYTMASNPQSSDIPEFFSSLEEIQGDLMMVRNKAMSELGRHFETGANITVGKHKTPLNDYFYSPIEPGTIGGTGMSPVESMLHSYMYDEGSANNERYFKSLRSMRYSENRQKKKHRQGIDSPYITKKDGKVYKQVAIGERVKLFDPDDNRGDSTKFIYTDGQGSVKHNITRKLNDIKKYKQMEGVGKTAEYLQKLEYELKLLEALEKSLVRGTPFVFSGYGKKQHTKLQGTLQKRHIKDVSQASSDSLFEFGNAPKKVNSDHVFSQALMEGQKLPNEYMGFNSSGTTYMGKHTVSNEAQRRGELRRERRLGNNQIPDKLDITKSIHIIPLNSKEARKGPGMLNAAVVAGVSTPKRNRHADAVRDITAIEYGGPATDSSGGYSKRTDGMFYLPSFFFTRAATEASAFLGLDPGNIIKTREKSMGREMTLHLKSSDPNRKRARTKARTKDRAMKEIKKGQRNLHKAQMAFVALRRKAMRGNDDEALRMMNRRALKSFNATENMPLEEGVMNDRFIDPDYVLSDTHDRYLKEGVIGRQEFRMKSLGRAKRSLGEAGIGGGMVQNYMGKIEEISPSQYASVWEVDGQSLTGRMPYVPVFDQQIYRQLLRANSWEAKKYLRNTKTRLGKLLPEYTQSIGDIGANSNMLMGTILGDTNYSTLKKLIGENSQQVRASLKAAIGINYVEIRDYQKLVSSPQGPGSEIGQIREALAGGKTKANLTRLYLEKMEQSLQGVFSTLSNSEVSLIRDKLKIQAARTASKVANSITTVWGRTSAGGVFLDGTGFFNALERTAILLEQGFASTTDTVGLMAAAHAQLKGTAAEQVAKTFLDSNRGAFTFINRKFDKVANQFVDDTTVIEIGEQGFEERLSKTLEAYDRDEEDKKFNWSGANRYGNSSTYSVEDPEFATEKVVYTGKNKWKFDGSLDPEQAGKEMKRILFEEKEVDLLRTQELAKSIANRFSFSTKEGIFADRLLQHYNDNNIFPDARAVGAINATSGDRNSAVFNSKTGLDYKDFKAKKGGLAFDVEEITGWGKESKWGNDLTGTAKSLFRKKIHYLVDPSEDTYAVIKKGRNVQGVQSMRTVDMPEFSRILGNVFRKHGPSKSIEFLEELITESGKGTQSNQRDKQEFVKKVIQHAGENYDQFFSVYNVKSLKGESNNLLYSIFQFYKTRY